MTVNVHNLIAAIVPEVYCDRLLRKEVKEIAKKEGYLKAAEKAKPVEAQFMDLEQERFINNPFLLRNIKNPIEKHTIVYDNFSQALEPIYFWILDYINVEYKDSDKLIDNFLTSPGSAQFGEIGQRTTRMQEEAMKMFQTSGVIIKSILQIVYDLKEFKIRLSLYDDLKSSDSKIKSAALLSLKQIWLDQVDFTKRGTTSLKQMAAQFDYVTILDAFFAANTLDDVKNLDLNERVKRILEQRVAEFEKWIKESERELRKRFEIERIYLKNQVNSVMLYARWIKPYLRAAKQLEQQEKTTPHIINAFNSTLLELSIIGKRLYNVEEDIGQSALPKAYRKLTGKGFTSIVVVEFRYRSAPERISQQGGYGYRGRIEIDFTSYALAKDEIKLMKELIEKDNFGDLISMIEGSTTESLQQIQADLDEFIGGKEEKKKESEDVNPFTSLFSIFKPQKKESEGLSADSDDDLILRNQAILRGREECYKLYGNFKATINMPNF